MNRKVKDVLEVQLHTNGGKLMRHALVIAFLGTAAQSRPSSFMHLAAAVNERLVPTPQPKPRNVWNGGEILSSVVPVCWRPEPVVQVTRCERLHLTEAANGLSSGVALSQRRLGRGLL
ncbi:hypothetical protein [Novosphingobium pokkalii]|uniref:Secreted protein n=1 Tax=Novosphingobium pokkalii TaxID=1770194 RepID=A0ABV7V3Z1_9SPHN|nr:hypothetical protein [Novosphingobium pokkalii]